MYVLTKFCGGEVWGGGNSVMSLEFSTRESTSVLGSMRGQKMKDAREALFLFLKSLPADCYFNIVSFGSSCRFLFQQ